MGAQQGNRGFRRSHKTIQLYAVHLIPLGLSLYLVVPAKTPHPKPCVDLAAKAVA